MVTGGMGLPVRMTARLIVCFQHPAHPLRLKTWRVVFSLNQENEAMANKRQTTATTNGAPTPAATATPKPKRRTARNRATTCEAPAVYGVPSGALSFRNRLTARECSAIDRALAIVGRSLSTNDVTMTDPATVKTYLQLHLAGEKVEHFGAMYLDVQHRLIAFEVHASGTLAQASVYPREIVRSALAHHAAAVILTHNHPSGSTSPSRADKELTQTLKVTLSLVDVKVLDHVIVAPGAACSMAEIGVF